MTGRAVRGRCPMGCGETLFIGEGGWITCSFISCPRPAAVADLLDDRETEHLVTFSDDGFTVKHPLRERLDDALLACELHLYIAGLGGPPVVPGRYRAMPRGDHWLWARVHDGVVVTP